MKKQKTFTKKWVSIIITIALIDMNIPFILAFMGREQIAETLAIAIVTEIIGVMGCYFAKSFFETRESERNRIIETGINKEEDVVG